MITGEHLFSVYNVDLFFIEFFVKMFVHGVHIQVLVPVRVRALIQVHGQECPECCPSK
jgi:hypothetical protein